MDVQKIENQKETINQPQNKKEIMSKTESLLSTKVEKAEFRKYIGKFMHNFNGADALVTAWNAGENIIMFGPGGYGKSVAAMVFYRFLQEKGFMPKGDPFVQTFHSSISEEQIFGGFDIKAYKEDNKLTYNLERSMFNHPFVILEELFDAPTDVVASMKVALTAGKVYNGEQVFNIKTRFIVGCTNRTYDEVVVDMSSAALMERFVVSSRVEWSSYKEEDYFRAIETSVRSMDKHFQRQGAVKFMWLAACASAEVAAELLKVSEEERDGTFVSPRTAVKAFKATYLNQSYDSLKNFRDFDDLTVNKAVKRITTKMKTIEQQQKLMRAFAEFTVYKNKAAEATEAEDILQYATRMARISGDNISSMRLSDDAEKVRTKIRTAIMSSLRDTFKKLVVGVAGHEGALHPDVVKAVKTLDGNKVPYNKGVEHVDLDPDFTASEQEIEDMIEKVTNSY